MNIKQIRTLCEAVHSLTPDNMTVSEFIFNLKRQNNIKLAFIIESADSLLQQFDAHDKEISESCESLNSLLRNIIETDTKFH